jgi:hypothetical protein
MNNGLPNMNRRQVLAGLGATAALTLSEGAAAFPQPVTSGQEPRSTDPNENKALIAITYDLEMSGHYPTWDQLEWNFEKGLLDDATKEYTVKAARRVKAAGGVMHDFVVGRVLEEENIDFLKDLLREGHQLGNHTYDHVYILATRPEDLQFRFQRAPWLIYGKDPREVIIENIRMCERAMQTRLGIYPKGFRAPGGFKTGIDNRPDIQLMLISLGYEWVSTKYGYHPLTKPGEAPTEEILEAIVQAQKGAQPYLHPSGLVEIPMSPVSDVVAMRTCRWKLNDFHRALRKSLQWVIDNRAVFDLLCHPSVIGVEDPGLETIDLILDIVKSAGDLAAIVDPEVIARRARAQSPQTLAGV